MKKGFTVVEMLIVVAIISVLAGIAVFSASAVRNKAALTRAKAELDQIATGALLYYQDVGIWAPDVMSFANAAFYNDKYVPITADPLSYFEKNYVWDWENWGNDPFFNSPPNNFKCWQSVDLFRYVTGDPNKPLVMRRCLRDVCVNQKYCDEAGICYNTKQNRDNGTSNVSDPGYLGRNTDIGASAVCEDCSSQIECAKKFLPLVWYLGT